MFMQRVDFHVFLGMVKRYLGGVWQHELEGGRGQEAAPAR